MPVTVNQDNFRARRNYTAHPSFRRASIVLTCHLPLSIPMEIKFPLSKNNSDERMSKRNRWFGNGRSFCRPFITWRGKRRAYIRSRRIREFYDTYLATPCAFPAVTLTIALLPPVPWRLRLCTSSIELPLDEWLELEWPWPDPGLDGGVRIWPSLSHPLSSSSSISCSGKITRALCNEITINNITGLIARSMSRRRGSTRTGYSRQINRWKSTSTSHELVYVSSMQHCTLNQKLCFRENEFNQKIWKIFEKTIVFINNNKCINKFNAIYITSAIFRLLREINFWNLRKVNWISETIF